jgi:RNA polymerase sigma factor (sigma-70 family)
MGNPTAGRAYLKQRKAAVGGIARMLQSPGCDDRQTLQRIAAGDRQALAELYARHRQMLFRYLLQLTPDRGLAEELLQDTLVAVWRSARAFAGHSSVTTWLIGIARRQAHNSLRRKGLPLADPAVLGAMPAGDLTPEDALLATVAREQLDAAFARLAPLHREVLALAFVQELPYAEIAAVLDIPVGTVKSRLNHARRALRAALGAAEGAER